MRSTFKVLFYVKKGSEKPNGNLAKKYIDLYNKVTGRNA